jgi:hypothetical protein
MSTVPSGTRFIGISTNVNLTERKSAMLNAETQPYTIQDLVDTIGTGSQGPQGVQGPAGPPGPVGPAGLEWQGTWVSGTSYVEDDAVGYNGASYFCILATSGTTAPNLATANWALLASQGAIGPTGAQGPTGPQGPSGGAPYKECAFKLSQSGTNAPSAYNYFINQISVGSSPSDPLYRTTYFNYVSPGVYEIGWAWLTGSASQISTPKLDFSVSSGRIEVTAETNFTIGPYSGYKFTIGVRDSSGALANNALGFVNAYFRLFN